MSRRRHEALERFERATDLPLLLLALAMVPLLLVPLVVEIRGVAADAVMAAEWFIWAAFAVEYVVRLVLSERRWRFVRQNWPDLLIVVLPLLRPLRVVRSARALRLLGLARVAAFLARATRNGRRLLVGHGLHYALLITSAVVVGAALLVEAVEEESRSDIDSLGDALWWSVTTVTTVGYGDTVPVTPAGRWIAAALMVAGITAFGVLTANLAAYFIEHDDAGAVDANDERLDEILRRLEVIERHVAREDR